MLKNHEKRLTRTEDRLAETDKRVNKHDIIFERLTVDLEYMKKGIDALQAGQERLETSMADGMWRVKASSLHAKPKLSSMPRNSRNLLPPLWKREKNLRKGGGANEFYRY